MRDKDIRKPIVLVGLILVVIGFSIWSLASLRKASWEIVESTENEYSFSTPLKSGDKIVVELRPGANWTLPPFEISDDPRELEVIWVIVDIKDPAGNQTRFFTAYTHRNPSLMVRYGDIEITQLKGLDPAPFYDETTKLYNEIGGIVTSDGVYNVTIFDIFPRNPNADPNSWRDPPSYLAIRREKVIAENLTTYTLIGVGALSVGSVIALFGVRSSKRKRLTRKKSMLGR